jgi:TonB family protein
MPNDQLDGLLNRLVSGTGELTGAELEQLRSTIFGTFENDEPNGVADIAAELDARKENDQGKDGPCELKSAEDYLARVAAEDQPVPASLLRLVGAAPAIRTTAHFPDRASRLAGLRSKHVLPWGSAIAATVLAGVSGYFVHDFVVRSTPAPANAVLPGDIADARRPPENSTVANTDAAPPQQPAPSTNIPVPTLAVTPPTPLTSHAVTQGDYPSESVRLQEQGTVKVKYLVLINGSVGECQVEISSGYPDLDDAACAVVKHWQFKPATTTDGSPVEWWLDAGIAFRLAGAPAPPTAPQAPAVADARPGTTAGGAISGSTPPIATTSHAVTADDYPPVSIRLQEQGKVSIKYLVREDGTVGDCNVTTSSGKARLDAAACTMAKRRWKFKPATLNGKSVSEFLTAEVAFNLNGGAALSPSPQAPAVANSQSSPAPARGLQTKNEALVKAINDMDAAARAQNWALALEKAKEADAIKDDKPAALNAPIHAMIVTAAINAKDYAAAMAQLDKNIATGKGNRTTNLRQALSIAILAKNKEKTDQYAKDLGGKLDNETRLFIASGMMNPGQLQDALEYAKPALEGNPSEAALKFEEALYSKMNSLAGRRAALEQLVQSYPRLEYWHDLLQLARSYKGLTDDQAMDIYRLRLAVGDLKTDADFQEMAQEALVAGYATEAKTVLNKAQAENLLSGERDQRLVKMATDRAARDGAAIADLQRRARSDPNSAIRLGLLYWSTGKYKEAEVTIRAAIATRKLIDPNPAQMALGHVLLSESKNQEAATAFRSVHGPNAAAVSIGGMWASYAVAPAPSRPPQAPAVAVVQFVPFMRALIEASGAEVSHRWAECLEKAREADAINYDKSPGLSAEIHGMIISCAVNSKDYATALGQLDQNIATGEGNKELNLTLALTFATMSKNKEKADQYESQLTRLLAGIRPPVATTSHAVTAEDYPLVSIGLQEQGNVMVMYLVNEDGRVDACNVIASSGYSRLDDAACVMVTNRWKFKPAMQNGKPVAGYLTAEVVFQLK